jgi:hypothetical protein
MKIKIISTITILAIAITATVFAVAATAKNENIPESVSNSVYNTSEFSTIDEMDEEELKMIMEKAEELNRDITVKSLADAYGKTEEEILKLKAELKTWEAVSQKLLSGIEEAKRLPKEKVLELYNEGYGVRDIEKAEEIAIKSDKAPEEILELKGKTTDFNERMADEEDAKKKGNLYRGSKKNYKARTWKEVTDVMGIDDADADEASIEEEADMSRKGTEQMKKGKIEKSENTEKLEKTKESEKEEKTSKTVKASKKETLEEREQHYINQLDISNDTVNKCRKNGLRDFDMVRVDALSKQYNVSPDKIIELKKTKKNWSEVDRELGGAGH